MQVDVIGNVTERHGGICATLLSDEGPPRTHFCVEGGLQLCRFVCLVAEKEFVRPELVLKKVVPLNDHKSSVGKSWAMPVEIACGG